MSKKFILMGVDDDSSKKVAEVLSNTTCKKILNYMSEANEVSENDISVALGIPINTVEYNLNKLIDAGLVEKTKNYFWSKKGKKISMFKVTNKHIVISPKSKPTMSILKTIIPVIIAIAFLTVLLIYLIPPKNQVIFGNNVTTITPGTEMSKFNSIDELKNFLNDNTAESSGGYSQESIQMTPNAATGVAKSSADSSFESG
jgi:DNA-binding transcriptional ArsR family regulator